MVAHAGHECCPGGLLMGGISMDSIPENVLADAGAGYWLWPRGAWASASTHCRGFSSCGAGMRCVGVVWFVWFGMLLGFEATSLLPGEWLPGFFLWGGSWWCSLG